MFNLYNSVLVLAKEEALEKFFIKLLNLPISSFPPKQLAIFLDVL